MCGGGRGGAGSSGGVGQGGGGVVGVRGDSEGAGRGGAWAIDIEARDAARLNTVTRVLAVQATPTACRREVGIAYFSQL